MREKKMKIKNSNILIMGLTFKENCPDTRNSKIFDLSKELKKYKINVSIFDPWVNKKKLNNLNSIRLIQKPKKNYYDCIILSVAHDIFIKLGIDKIKKLTKKNHIIYDLKYLFSNKSSNLRL